MNPNKHRSKKKTEHFTRSQLATLKMEWYNRGKRQALKEYKRELAERLGLYDLFEVIRDDY